MFQLFLYKLQANVQCNWFAQYIIYMCKLTFDVPKKFIHDHTLTSLPITQKYKISLTNKGSYLYLSWHTKRLVAPCSNVIVCISDWGNNNTIDSIENMLEVFKTTHNQYITIWALNIDCQHSPQCKQSNNSHLQLQYAQFSWLMISIQMKGISIYQPFVVSKQVYHKLGHK